MNNLDIYRDDKGSDDADINHANVVINKGAYNYDSPVYPVINRRGKFVGDQSYEPTTVRNIYELSDEEIQTHLDDFGEETEVENPRSHYLRLHGVPVETVLKYTRLEALNFNYTNSQILKFPVNDDGQLPVLPGYVATSFNNLSRNSERLESVYQFYFPGEGQVTLARMKEKLRPFLVSPTREQNRISRGRASKIEKDAQINGNTMSLHSILTRIADDISVLKTDVSVLKHDITNHDNPESLTNRYTATENSFRHYQNTQVGNLPDPPLSWIIHPNLPPNLPRTLEAFRMAPDSQINEIYRAYFPADDVHIPRVTKIELILRWLGIRVE